MQRKHRTHITEQADPSKKGDPKTFVFCRGKHGVSPLKLLTLRTCSLTAQLLLSCRALRFVTEAGMNSSTPCNVLNASLYSSS